MSHPILQRIEDVFKYKPLHTSMPLALVKFNDTLEIIPKIRTDIVVNNRKKILAANGDQDEKTSINAKSIKCAINCALNKLTHDNIVFVKDELLSVCYNSTPEYVSSLAHEIIQRASAEKSFIEVYARMCGQLAPLKCSDGTFFSTFIERQSKAVFDEYITDCKSAPRTTVINFIKFIGYLYIYDILKSVVVDVCIKTVSENILSLEFGSEMITSILDIVYTRYFATCDQEKIIAIRNRLNVLSEIDSLCKRDKILLQLFIERINPKIISK
jgi:hypothetical protein